MTLIYTRYANNHDLSEIMIIINEAKLFLKQSGSSQWQGSYPNEEMIQSGIRNKCAFVLVVDNQVAGYAASIIDEESIYQKINGSWKSKTSDYATFHQLATGNKYHGVHLANLVFLDLVSIMVSQEIKNFRIDASRENRIM